MVTWRHQKWGHLIRARKSVMEADQAMGEQHVDKLIEERAKSRAAG